MNRKNRMKKIIVNDPETRSADVIAKNLEHLKVLFPEAFTEGKVDFEVLKQLLGGAWTSARRSTASTGMASGKPGSLRLRLPPAPFDPARRKASIGTRRKT